MRLGRCAALADEILRDVEKLGVPVNQGVLWEVLSLSTTGLPSVMAATVPVVSGIEYPEAHGCKETRN